MSTAVFHSHAPTVPGLAFPKKPDFGELFVPVCPAVCVSHTDTLTPPWEGKTPLPAELSTCFELSVRPADFLRCWKMNRWHKEGKDP